MRRLSWFFATSILASSLLTACGEDDPIIPADEAPQVDLTLPVNVPLEGPAPQYLSEYNLFAYSQDTGFVFHDDVIPYDMNTALFTDYALKSRAIYLPEGESFAYEENDIFDFPVGTLILKTFYYAADLREPTKDLKLIETRILALRESGWTAHPYIWNEEQTQAILSPAGEVRVEHFIDLKGQQRSANYLVPQRTQCQSCHARKVGESPTEAFLPIGPKARHLNRTYHYEGAGERNQLEYLAERGWLTGLPALEEVPAAYDFEDYERTGVIDVDQVNRAARDYLDINCAHCHSPVGVQGVSSQLFLNHDNTDVARLGVCKQPGSSGKGTGGHTYDIVPGLPEESILHFRIDTVDPGSMMPLIARSLRHDEGVDLIHMWIEDMQSDAFCSENPITEP